MKEKDKFIGDMKYLGILAVAILMTGILPQAVEGKWYNPREEFWPELKDWEYIQEFELTIKIISLQKHTPSFVISSNGQEELVKGKEFKKDGEAKVKMYFDKEDLDGNKEKISIKVLGQKDTKLTKTFSTKDKDFGKVSFYYKK